jgi:phage gp29-like protein
VKTIERSDREMIIAVAGQEVTVDGGAGFQNSDVHKSIRADLIKETADGLAYTLNTQGIPPWIAARWGVDALAESAVVEWDVTPPKDRNSEATSLVTAGSAIKVLNEALESGGYEVDVKQLSDKFSIPVKKLAKAKPRLELVPEPEEDEARVA